MERKLGVAQAVDDGLVSPIYRIAIPENPAKIRARVDHHYSAALETLRRRPVSEKYRASDEAGRADLAARAIVLRAETGQAISHLMPVKPRTDHDELIMMAYGALAARPLPTATSADSILGEGWTADRVTIRLSRLLASDVEYREAVLLAAGRYVRLSRETVMARVIVVLPVLLGLVCLGRILRRPKVDAPHCRRSDLLVFLFLAGWLAQFVAGHLLGGEFAFVAPAVGLLAPIAFACLSGTWPAIWRVLFAPDSAWRLTSTALALSAVNFVFGAAAQPMASCSAHFDLLPIGELIGTVVAVPMMEEVLFRGFLFSGLRAHMGWPAAAMLSSVAFSLVHPPLFHHLVGAAITGLIFAWGFERTRNIIPCVVAHAFWNLTTLTPWNL